MIPRFGWVAAHPSGAAGAAGGANTGGPRPRSGAAGAAARENAGRIASSSGRAMVTPTPRRKLRRERAEGWGRIYMGLFSPEDRLVENDFAHERPQTVVTIPAVLQY